MTQDQLLKLAQRYDDKANKAYYNYQETGMPRYDRERSNAEDLAEALRMAATAEEDHSKLIALKAEVVDLAYRAETTLPDNQRTLSILNDIVSLAEIFCGYRRIEKL